MSRWSRRRFLGTSAAALCAGCTGSDEPAVLSGSSRELDETPTIPPPGPGLLPFGQPIDVGSIDDGRDAADGSPLFVAEARAWLVAVDPADVEALLADLDDRLHDGLRVGLLALSQRCPHLGCRVPFCESSGWFECPCHGSRYTLHGEHRAGPGPRGMDAHPILIDADRVLVDAGTVIDGPALGSVVVDRPAAGPHCVEPAER